MKKLAWLLIVGVGFAQTTVAPKTTVMGKTTLIAASPVPLLSVLNRIVDRAAYNNTVKCNLATPTVCTLTFPATTAGSYGIIHLHGLEGSAFTIASISGACTWTRPTGADVFLSGAGIDDGMACTDGMSAGVTSVTITFSGALGNPDYVNPQYLEVGCSGSCTPTVVASSNSNGSPGTSFTGPALTLGGSQSIVSQLAGCDPLPSAAASPYDTNFTNNSIPGGLGLTAMAASYVVNVTSTGAAVWTVSGTTAGCVGSAIAIKAN